MKHILIVGKTSYIGTSFQKYVQKNYSSDLRIDAISVRDHAWEDMELSQYDVILYCAALVHQRETTDMSDDYMKINRHLPVAFAQKAKRSGVRQFIFLSTMAVYGLEGTIGKAVVIDSHTPFQPQTLYAKSKRKAEEELLLLSDETFKICILRPPMVYGPDCPGNYQKLRKFVLKYKIFPTIKNQRSMLTIDRLCAFIADLIFTDSAGTFHPQNPKYACTLAMAQEIAAEAGVKLHCWPWLNPFIWLGGLVHPAFRKVWGGLIYAKNTEDDISTDDNDSPSGKFNSHSRKKQILFLCQFFYPEYISSATLPFDTATALSNNGYTVDVMCGFPKEYVSSSQAASTEMVNNILIKRVRYIQSLRSSLIGRLSNIFSFTLSILFHFREFRGYEFILVYSNPPILPLIPVLSKKIYGVKFIFICYDVYPEIAIRTNAASSTGMMAKVMNFINSLVYKNVSSVVALSSEMKTFLSKNRPITPDKISVIPNWYENKVLNASLPANSNFYSNKDKFVVSYLGNMGVCQDMATIIDCARNLKQDESIQFLFAGHGEKKQHIEKIVESEQLTNVRIFDFLQGEDYDDILSRSDCFLISLEENLTGLCVPSKTYSYMMAGKPIIAIMGSPCDIADDLENGGSGYIIRNHDIPALTNAIIDLKNDPLKSQAMGKRASLIFQKKYTTDICTSKYVELISQLLDTEI